MPQNHNEPENIPVMPLVVFVGVDGHVSHDYAVSARVPSSESNGVLTVQPRHKARVVVFEKNRGVLVSRDTYACKHGVWEVKTKHYPASTTRQVERFRPKKQKLGRANHYFHASPTNSGFRMPQTEDNYYLVRNQIRDYSCRDYTEPRKQPSAEPEPEKTVEAIVTIDRDELRRYRISLESNWLSKSVDSYLATTPTMV